MRLIQPALDDAGILRRLRISHRLRILHGLQILRGFIFGRRDLGRACWLAGRLRRSGGGGLEDRAGPGSGRRRGILAGLTMRDEFVVARGAGPRRNVVGHAAGPMRPMVGNIAGKLAFASAGRETRAKTEYDCRRDESFDDHSCRRAVEPAGKLHRAALIIRFDRVAA
jgi:hypothetical protein